jgi:hypothetical protein
MFAPNSRQGLTSWDISLEERPALLVSLAVLEVTNQLLLQLYREGSDKSRNARQLFS